MPLMEFFNISGTIRASFSFYNTKNEVKQLIGGLGIAFKMLS
jgi:cysteine desulfurase/selenocysteine lyase